MPPTTKPASKTGKTAKPAKADTKPAAKTRESKTEAKPEPKAATAKVAPPKSKEPAKVEAKRAEPDAPKKAEDRATVAREEPMTMPKIAAAPPVEERVSITTTMSKPQLERFRKLLEEKRDDIVKKARETLGEEMILDTNDLPDEMDLASSEYLQSFQFRLRGREKSFLEKIDRALQKIDRGEFGLCEECGEEISVKRLEARPETTLCIKCKEDQERAEKDFS